MKTSETGARGGGKMKPLRISILLLGFIILSIPALADTLYLKDGRFYRGKYMKGDKNGVQFKSDDKIMGFPLVSVSFISVGEKDSKDHPANEMGNGILKGMVTYSRLNSDRGPDFGAKVYACKIRGDNILIFYKYGELLRSNEIDDFIKDYIKYRWAKWNRNLLWRQDLKPEKAKDILAGKQSQLKELGADTEKGWERVRDRGRAVLEKLGRGEIPSRLALAERDGSFSFQLPAGYYFLLAQSQENRLEDAYTAVKISDGRTTGISLEIIFLQLGNQGDSPLN
jgi:hypothetical protein